MWEATLVLKIYIGKRFVKQFGLVGRYREGEGIITKQKWILLGNAFFCPTLR